MTKNPPQGAGTAVKSKGVVTWESGQTLFEKE